jgi:hypothetical protein
VIARGHATNLASVQEAGSLGIRTKQRAEVFQPKQWTRLQAILVMAIQTIGTHLLVQRPRRPGLAYGVDQLRFGRGRVAAQGCTVLLFAESLHPFGGNGFDQDGAKGGQSLGIGVVACQRVPKCEFPYRYTAFCWPFLGGCGVRISYLSWRFAISVT